MRLAAENRGASGTTRGLGVALLSPFGMDDKRLGRWEDRVRWCRAFLFGLAYASLAGCIIVPYPADISKGRAVDVDPKTAFQTGTTTREEVLARLGKPDHDTIGGGHVFVYSWWHASWGLARVGGLGSGHGAAASYHINYLIIKFDESDRVVGAEQGETPDHYENREQGGWGVWIKFLDGSYDVLPDEPKPKSL